MWLSDVACLKLLGRPHIKDNNFGVGVGKLYSDEFILVRAYSDLLTVGYPRLPTCIRMDVVELVIGSLVVVVGPLVTLFNNVGEAVAGRDCGSCINDVGTGTVKSYGME